MDNRIKEMYTLENGKITSSAGVTLSLEDIVTQLNKSEILMGELTEALTSIPHPSPKHDNYFDSFVANHRLTPQNHCVECGEGIAGEGYNNWRTCEICLEYDAQSEATHESQYGVHWQNHNEPTSYGRGNW